MTTFEIGESTVNAKHSKTSVPARLPRDKASCEARGISLKKLDVVGEHPNATKFRSRKMRTQIALMLNGIDLEEFGAPGTAPVMFTLKNPGSNKKRHATLPSDHAKNETIKEFQKLYEARTGQKLLWLWFMDTNTRGGSIHLHGLVCPPAWMSEAEFAEMLDNIWAEALRRKDLMNRFDHESGEGSCTWVPQGDDVRHYDTLREAVADFATYEQSKYNPEKGRAEQKIAQKQTDKKWLATGNYRVVWAGTTVAPAPKLRAYLHCECGVADVYSLMQEHTVAPRDIREFDCRTEADKLINLDVARWSLDFRRRGATEFMVVTDEFIAAIRAIEEAHDACTAPAPVAAEEAPTAPAATPKSSTPAGAPTASSASTATSLTNEKENAMSEINQELKNMFTADEIEAIRDRAEEAWAKENFPVISIEQRHAELEAVKADPTLTFSEREHLVAVGSALLDTTINTIVRDEMTEVTDEDRLALVAEKVTSRFEPIIPHLKSVTADAADEFAGLSPLAQFDELLAPAAPVEIPRIASDPHARRPRFVAGLTSRTDADIAYLAAFVRLERSADAMVSGDITLEDHVSNYERETNLINRLMESGKMTPIPVEWLEARRAGAL